MPNGTGIHLVFIWYSFCRSDEKSHHHTLCTSLADLSQDPPEDKIGQDFAPTEQEFPSACQQSVKVGQESAEAVLQSVEAVKVSSEAVQELTATVQESTDAVQGSAQGVKISVETRTESAEAGQGAGEMSHDSSEGSTDSSSEAALDSREAEKNTAEVGKDSATTSGRDSTEDETLSEGSEEEGGGEVDGTRLYSGVTSSLGPEQGTRDSSGGGSSSSDLISPSIEVISPRSDIGGPSDRNFFYVGIRNGVVTDNRYCTD